MGSCHRLASQSYESPHPMVTAAQQAAKGLGTHIRPPFPAGKPFLCPPPPKARAPTKKCGAGQVAGGSTKGTPFMHFMPPS